MNGKTIIFSAPSGSGKTTIVHKLLGRIPQLAFSISACTRQPRPHEQDGVDYYFLSPGDFQNKIKNDAFIEWEQVYEGTYYGTLKSEVYRLWDEGKHVIFDVDVVGGLNLKNYFKEKGLAIYVEVPSFDILEDRLKSRNTDSPSKIEERLKKARYESTFKDKFDLVLVNANLEASVETAERWIQKFLNAGKVTHD